MFSLGGEYRALIPVKVCGGNCSQVLSSTREYWRVLATTYEYLKVLASTCSYWRVLASTCEYWQVEEQLIPVVDSLSS